MTELSLLDRIELRRFVGRELLLWLWFESELFEGTLATKPHGTFGFWLEGRLVLDVGRESTVIKGSAPGHHREAKEALLNGKIPSRAGVHVSIGDREIAFTLVGETLALAGLSAPATPRAVQDEGTAKLADAKPRPKKRRAESEGAPDDEMHVAFYDRMHHARDVEAVLHALYEDFLTLRLGPAWDADVVPALEAWSTGERFDRRRYETARSRALGRRAPSR